MRSAKVEMFGSRANLHTIVIYAELSSVLLGNTLQLKRPLNRLRFYCTVGPLLGPNLIHLCDCSIYVFILWENKKQCAATCHWGFGTYVFDVGAAFFCFGIHSFAQGGRTYPRSSILDHLLLSCQKEIQLICYPLGIRTKETVLFSEYWILAIRI